MSNKHFFSMALIVFYFYTIVELTYILGYSWGTAHETTAYCMYILATYSSCEGGLYDAGSSV
jgi:hypothetical protein